MKKNIFIIFTFFISNFCFSQQYEGVIIEKRKIDKNNLIYKIEKSFFYSIEIKKNDIEYFLDKGFDDSLTINKSKKNGINEIKLLVTKPKIFQRTNKNQTEIKYNFEPNPISITCTGIVENDNNVWIHPPRLGFLKVLETCPFPYIKLNQKVGYEWNDEMSIAEYWSNKNSGIWTGRLLLKYNYKIIGEEKITTNIGELECKVISASANSTIGQSTLVAYFNDKYGFVKLKYKLFTGTEININLEKISQ
jgi:hypothetical protein